MRKHEYKHVEKYNVDYRPLTHTEFTPTQILSKGMFTCIKENIFSFWHFWKVKY
ncbi:baseplate hub subunit [Klebsiella phage CPRSA]|nr:baseplate hub subunit [Klebsiella phage CPRSA]